MGREYGLGIHATFHDFWEAGGRLPLVKMDNEFGFSESGLHGLDENSRPFTKGQRIACQGIRNLGNQVVLFVVGLPQAWNRRS